MYLLASSFAAALLGEKRVLARWGGRVRVKAFLNILFVFFNILPHAKRAKPAPPTPR